MAYRIRVIPKKKRRIMRADRAMKTPYGLEIIEGCLTCPMMKDRLFCNLPPERLRDSTRFRRQQPTPRVRSCSSKDRTRAGYSSSATVA